MNIRVFFFLSFLLIGAQTVQSQTNVADRYGKPSAVPFNLFHTNNQNKKIAAGFVRTPIDSIRQRLLANQKQIQSQTGIITGPQIIHNLYQIWAGSDWKNSTLETTTTDASGNVTDDLFQTWKDGVWVNGNRYTSVFDENGNEISDVYQIWGGSSWGNIWQQTYSYDELGNETTSLYQTWNGIAWVNVSQDNFIYDKNGNETSDLFQTGNDFYLYTFTYDQDGKLTNYVNQFFDGITWINIEQYNFTYDTTGMETGNAYQIWNGSSWFNIWQHRYAYDGNGNETSDVYQIWNRNAWLNNSDYIYSYDTKGHSVGSLYQVWNGSIWIMIEQSFLSYNHNGQKTLELYQTRNNSGWMNASRNYYEYQQVISEQPNLPAQFRLLDNYPNPFNSTTVIKYELPVPSYMSLRVYNLLGQVVATLAEGLEDAGFKTASWNTGNLPSGVYFYRLAASNFNHPSQKFVQVKKMVYVK